MAVERDVWVAAALRSRVKLSPRQTRMHALMMHGAWHDYEGACQLYKFQIRARLATPRPPRSRLRLMNCAAWHDMAWHGM